MAKRIGMLVVGFDVADAYIIEKDGTIKVSANEQLRQEKAEWERRMDALFGPPPTMEEIFGAVGPDGKHPCGHTPEEHAQMFPSDPIKDILEDIFPDVEFEEVDLGPGPQNKGHLH